MRDDGSASPSVRSVTASVALRCLAPALVWFGVVAGIGWLITGVFGGLTGENELNRDLQSTRTPFWDGVTKVASEMANTFPTMALAALAMVVVYLLTRRWRTALMPILAVSVQAAIFLTVTLLTDRSRPDVPHLDEAPPTSSFPSGHVGATSALYFTFAILAHRIPNVALRRVLTVLFSLVPLWVAYARMYRGMHHLSDVIVGLLNGFVSAYLAYRALREDEEPVSK